MGGEELQGVPGVALQVNKMLLVWVKPVLLEFRPLQRAIGPPKILTVSVPASTTATSIKSSRPRAMG